MNLPKSLEIKVSNYDGYFGLFAKLPIKKGGRIFQFKGFMGSDAQTSELALQIDEDIFLESNESYSYENFLNHSCCPNGYIDFKNLYFTVLKDIRKGEELTFNYNTTEYDLLDTVTPSNFICNCKSERCIKEVKGFRYLTLKQKIELQPYLSPFLQKN